MGRYSRERPANFRSGAASSSQCRFPACSGQNTAVRAVCFSFLETCFGCVSVLPAVSLCFRFPASVSCVTERERGWQTKGQQSNPLYLLGCVYIVLFLETHRNKKQYSYDLHICVFLHEFLVSKRGKHAGQRFTTPRRKLAGERGDRTAVRFSAGSGLARVGSAIWRVLRV